MPNVQPQRSRGGNCLESSLSWPEMDPLAAAARTTRRSRAAAGSTGTGSDRVAANP